MTLHIRPTTPADLDALRDIFNHFNRQGGTTAHAARMSGAEFKSVYFDDPDTCLGVLSDGRPCGFQATFGKGGGVYSITSFTDRADPVPGAGAALFPATCAAVRALGGTAIIAVIAAENAPGLAYYSRMGCSDHDVIAGGVTRDGRSVDQIVKRLEI